MVVLRLIRFPIPVSVFLSMIRRHICHFPSAAHLFGVQSKSLYGKCDVSLMSAPALRLCIRDVDTALLNKRFCTRIELVLLFGQEITPVWCLSSYTTLMQAASALLNPRKHTPPDNPVVSFPPLRPSSTSRRTPMRFAPLAGPPEPRP